MRQAISCKMERSKSAFRLKLEAVNQALPEFFMRAAWVKSSMRCNGRTA
jgi:hypothetical protein